MIRYPVVVNRDITIHDPRHKTFANRVFFRWLRMTLSLRLFGNRYRSIGPLPALTPAALCARVINRLLVPP